MSYVLCQTEIAVQRAADADMAEAQQKNAAGLAETLARCRASGIHACNFGRSVAMLDVFVW